MSTRRVLPVLREAEFRAMVQAAGAWVEIECLVAPDPEKRHRGEWVFYVATGPDQRCVLVTSKAQERVISTTEGVVSFASTTLDLDVVSIPLIAGGLTVGMCARQK